MQNSAIGRLFRWAVVLLELLGPVAVLGQAPAKLPPAGKAPTNVQLLLSPATLPVTGVFTVSFRVRGGALEGYSGFPELEGFKKSGRTSTTTTRIVQGQRFTDLTITQRYVPYGEGEYVIKSFQLTVNGVTLRGGGATVRVGPAAVAPPAAASTGAAPLQGIGSLDQLLGKPKPELYQEPADRAFLAVVPERTSVYVGEGVRVGLFFYLAPADQAALAFHDFEEQLPRLLRLLHQPTAWETPGPPASVTPDSLRWGGRLYLRFRLAESTYYPLTAQPLQFPPLALTMVKFKLLKKAEPGLDSRLPGYKTYVAPAVAVRVRALPPHPQREGAPVGSFQVREALARSTVRVGQPVTYTFGVEGRGNLTGLLAPALRPRPGLDVYGPEVREMPTVGGGRKLFRYQLVAHRPGPLPLDSLLQLVVFNPATVRYDTLRPTLRPVVRGAVPVAAVPARPEDDPFYGPALANADTTLQPLDVYRDVRRYANWLLLGLVGVAGIGWWRAGRRA